jgi:hypothetical protein
VKKVVSRFSGVPVDDMDLDIGASGSQQVTVRDDAARLFPFAFDPSVVPEVRIRSKNDMVHDGAQSRQTMAVLQHQQYSAAAAGARASAAGQQGVSTSFFSTNTDESVRYALAASSLSTSRNSSPGRAAAARVEAEYGVGFAVGATAGRGQTAAAAAAAAASVAGSSSPPQPGDTDKLKQVAIESSRNWAEWLDNRRTARSQHVRSVLVPSSKEQIEIERALQVRTIDDVRRVTKHASADLASAAQILQQKLEVVREEILRERIGDDAFAKTEGARGVLAPGPSKTSVINDGVSREPLVVNFR